MKLSLLQSQSAGRSARSVAIVAVALAGILACLLLLGTPTRAGSDAAMVGRPVSRSTSGVWLEQPRSLELEGSGPVAGTPVGGAGVGSTTQTTYTVYAPLVGRDYWAYPDSLAGIQIYGMGGMNAKNASGIATAGKSWPIRQKTARPGFMIAL